MNLSIVVPVFNEQDNLPLLYQQVKQAITPLNTSWEMILVDDGSSDNSHSVLCQLAADDTEHVRVIFLRRNFGQTAAISAGIDRALGEIIVLMDADLQNDPADIPMLIGHIAEGNDVVSGWRVQRKDAFITRTIPSRMANLLISFVTGVKLHDYGCTLKAYRREVLTGFRLYGEMHRFIPVYADSVGARLIEVQVNHHPRVHGKTSYGLSRTFKVILDLFTVKFLSSYAQKPIRLFGSAGLALIALSLAGFLYLIIRWFWGISMLASPVFLMSLMIAIMGFQSILMGLIAELLARTYHESQGKTTYTIRESLNFPPQA